MALHTEIPIHRSGIRLLDLAIKAQVQMPRTVKRALGEKITQHCVDMLDLMALANATQHETRAKYIHKGNGGAVVIHLTEAQYRALKDKSAQRDKLLEELIGLILQVDQAEDRCANQHRPRVAATAFNLLSEPI